MLMTASEDKTPSVFDQRWWLDAATGAEWQMIESASYGGVVARLPIYIRRVLGQQRICMPPWTRTRGPILSDVPGKSATMMRARLKAMDDLIGRLPPHLVFEQTFDPTVTDLLAFQLHGFDLGVQYTFRLPACEDWDALWRGMRDKTRNVIRRAAERFVVGVGMPAADFASFYFANMRYGGKRPMHSRGSLEAVTRVSALHGAGTTLYCADERGALAAAILMVWDDKVAYFLASSRDHRRAGNGAVSLLLWKAMATARSKGLTFDFDSFADRGGAMFVSQFGGQLVPRWTVSHVPAVVRLKRQLQKATYRPATGLVLDRRGVRPA
jgi:hypothetical protein